MTESASMVTYNHYHRHVIGSVGTPVGTVEVQIRDMAGNILVTGSSRRNLHPGPQYHERVSEPAAGNPFRLLG